MEFETTVFSHIIGALYGQALGNAWAKVAYLRPQQTWLHYNGWVDQFYPAPPDHPFYPDCPAGQVTATTYLTLAVAKTVIEHGQVTPAGAVEALTTWYDQLNEYCNTPLVDLHAKSIVEALKTGSVPKHISLYDTYLAATAIIPIGLIHPHNPTAAIEEAITFCTATHMTNVSTAGACAVAAAIAQAVSPQATLEEIIAVAVQGANLGFEQGHPGLGASVARRVELAVNWALDFSVNQEDRLQNLHDIIGVTPSTADVVPCAFGILAMVDGNPTETAIYAAALSGKADAVGAIAGAIAGTWSTVDAISQENIDTLTAVNPQLNFEDTAEGLYGIAQQNYHKNTQEPDSVLTSSFLDELAQATDKP